MSVIQTRVIIVTGHNDFLWLIQRNTSDPAQFIDNGLGVGLIGDLWNKSISYIFLWRMGNPGGCNHRSIGCS